ncbi:hypothetical protein MLD38_001012 [Melastoma candidum]|uniref:Uncharacterized protein n=1 Tax=Melastoma candidum TaxID=119954 RepID=A0ACB9SBS7_9MYRT|nr:hypothetical protein MLD38_001012 [Melastoma candidum]
MNRSDKADVAPAECCMCGDSGIPDELHRCKVCLSRYQHRYCSNQYPRDWSYQVCNWCLASRMEDPGDSTQKAVAAVQKNPLDPNSSRSKAAESDRDDGHTKKLRKSLSWKPDGLEIFGKGNGKVKKTGAESLEVSPTTTTLRKRIITRGQSEEMADRGGGPRLVSRSKVPRYKLLDEVSS